MGNRNKKNTIKDSFYLGLLGTIIISLSIYLFTFTTGVWSSDYTSEVLSFKQHETIDRLVEKKEKYFGWVEVVPEAPKVELVQLAEEKEDQGKSENESEWMNFISTAYVSDCEGCTGFTKWMEWDVRNTIYSPQGYRVIASDPSILPMGSLVKIRYGNTEFIARVMDIGGKIKRNKIDLLVSTESEAFQWGVKNIEIKVIEWGDET